ncbi:MAG: glycoside hydrolase family 88 protein [Bacteroidales bacterium]|nr:glycoside hydrolase family 88 protein [Bacteroidales bacterium]
MNTRRLLITAAASALALTMSAQDADYTFIKDIEPYSVKMVLSEMARNPQASYLDGLQGRLKWNYTTGLELRSFFEVAKRYDLDYPVEYVKEWADTMANDNGEILTYKLSNYTVDHICPARIYFDLYDIYGAKKYRKALDTVREQLDTHPRTEGGEFWHKKIYPHQVWLDGLYMALPFYAQYTDRFTPKKDATQCYDDIVHQFESAFRNTKDPETGLFRHAWDESKSMFWADPETGLSQHAWGRANGWYAVALVDVLDYLPNKYPGRKVLIDQLKYLLNAIKPYADPETGMWWQVMDRPGAEGNYLESSASIMFILATLKAYNRGYLDETWKDYALDLYRKFLRQFVRQNDDGTISITSCCSVAGLGGKENRAGDYAYYLSEPVIENDCKAVGPFIWASIEYEAATNVDYVYDGNCIKDGKHVVEQLPEKEPAFEGAEGGGKWSRGGKGGTVYTVTTLEDTGEEGSLRYAVEAEGPRIVQFAVKGDIHLKSELRVRNSCISILGETAPGEGVTIRDYDVYLDGVHDVIIRYMRFRLGDTAGIEEDSFGGRHCDNVILDHCSISWSTDENLSLYACTNSTVQWCIISEALNKSVHRKGEHGYGGIWGGRNVSFHHNLLAHNNSRNPRFDHPVIYNGDDMIYRRGSVEFYNNVVYNWYHKAIYGGEEGWYNLVNNWFRPGPGTKNVNGEFLEFYTSDITSHIPGSYYISGNVYDTSAAAETEFQHISPQKMTIYEELYRNSTVSEPYRMYWPATEIQSAEEAYKAVLKDVGASKKRDSIDKRIVKEVRKGTATYTGSVGGVPGIIDSQNDVL